MRLGTERRNAIDLTTTPIHLGLGSRALPVEGFGWEPETLEAYVAAVADDGPEGRMVMIFEGRSSGDHWERHPAGDEVVICLAGRVTVVHEGADGNDRIEVGPRQAAINPAGVWHTVEVEEPAWFMTITPGLGTEHRPR